MSDTPKRGAEWLRLKLLNGASRLWREPDSTRFSWRTSNAVLVDGNAPPKTYAREYVEQSDAAKLGLKASEAVAMMSIRIHAKDHTKRGKVMETWLRCEAIKRQIIRPYPSHKGMSHDRYPILVAFLVHAGIAQPRADGCNGYEWTIEYKTLRARADWLLRLAVEQGELRNPRASAKYSMMDR